MTEESKSKVRFTNAAIISALHKANGYITFAARFLGCSPMTIYRRMEKSQAIRDELELIREGELDIAEQKLREAILNGEAWAIALKLKTQGRKRGYVERQEVTGADGNTITVRLMDDGNGS